MKKIKVKILKGLTLFLNEMTNQKEPLLIKKTKYYLSFKANNLYDSNLNSIKDIIHKTIIPKKLEYWNEEEIENLIN